MPPQIECYVESWIIAMKESPAEIRVLYDALLAQNKTPQKLCFYYKKWNRRTFVVLIFESFSFSELLYSRVGNVEF